MAAPSYSKTPRWTHPDCSTVGGCDEFVARIDGLDVYWCPHFGQWIVRNGPEPENYLSCSSMRLSELMP
jgi:hypothetical protein